MVEFINPEFLYAIPVVIAIISIIIWKDFIGKQSNNEKILFFASRAAILSLLIVAAATPFVFEKSIVEGNYHVTLLVDESKSMTVYQDEAYEHNLETLKKSIEKEIPMDIKKISFGNVSAVGDAILNNLGPNENVLMLSDGQVTAGDTIFKAMLQAAALNATISAMNIEPKHRDVSIAIFGPSKTVPGVKNEYMVSLNRVGIDEEEIELIVKFDNDTVFQGKTKESSFRLDKVFSETGSHTIEARLNINDIIYQNDVFYKSIKVVEKVPVLFVSDMSASNPLTDILRSLYDLDEKNDIPSSLDKYYAVVINDMPASKLHNIDTLKKFIIENNGLFVVGGINSFDLGGYEGSTFSSLLPVEVGTGEEAGEGANVVLAIDISDSTGLEFGGKLKVDVEKSLAISAVYSMALNNRVGAVAFNTRPYLIEDIKPLSSIRVRLVEKIQRLTDSGGTHISEGLQGAYAMLEGRAGSKFIILISDGNSGMREETISIAKAISRNGMKIITIGVGEDTDKEFMKEIAREGNGFFLEPKYNNKLSIIFGDVEKLGEGKFGLVVMNEDHFISQGMELSAILNSYNQVVPKAGAELLISGDNGRTALTVWNFGLGRVATLNVFNSDNTLGQLLDRDNSKLISRTVNWVIGDPERRKPYYTMVTDARVGEYAKILVKSPTQPVSGNITFDKIDKDLYVSSTLAGEIGIHSILDTDYAVNYPLEIENLGMSFELAKAVDGTNGKFFGFNETDEIIDYIKEASKRVINKKIDFSLYFIAIALAIFIIEVSIRRWKEIR